MGRYLSALMAFVIPAVVLASVSGAHGFLLSWTDIFSSIISAITHFISGLLGSSSPSLSPQQQFNSQLSLLQNNEQNITNFFLAHASTYHIPTNVSFAVQVTDKNTTSNQTIGQLTAEWNAPAKSFQVHSGIVSTGISPTFAVTLPSSEFVAFSSALGKQDIVSIATDYAEYWVTNKINYTRVG
ncbi:MAG: hypothetical protein KGI04_00750 [Candidatus Micrarchaeota archaeon]|nr:hypothetical protein [Candidatus Micrarchaeota archaeon]